MTQKKHQVSRRRNRSFPLLAAYDLCLKCSHLFNILDARGAISVTERVGVIARVRALAVGDCQSVGRSAGQRRVTWKRNRACSGEKEKRWRQKEMVIIQL